MGFKSVSIRIFRGEENGNGLGTIALNGHRHSSFHVYRETGRTTYWVKVVEGHGVSI